jgi:hypothetical protein
MPELAISAEKVGFLIESVAEGLDAFGLTCGDERITQV